MAVPTGRLAGKIAIVTGAGSGIGEATAVLFAAEGAHVTVADKNASAAERVAALIGPSALALAGDVAKAAEVRAMIDRTVAAHGRLDILVNNAGFGITGSVVETSEDDWNALMAVNVNGVFLGCKYAIPLMAKGGGGSIVNTASTTSRVGIKNRAAYVTSKGAVAAMTRAMALDHVDQNIRINSVAPGTIESPYYERIFAEADDPVALRASLAARQPMMRLGTPQEVARAILFLASDDASFCTGSTLFADGGWTAR
jgi:meso-butanediol dehydrogenase / (S,S)-butanediol dehydrogenase / diacetyl reductase